MYPLPKGLLFIWKGLIVPPWVSQSVYRAAGAAKKVISSFISSLKYGSNWEAAEAGHDVGHDIKPGRTTLYYTLYRGARAAGSWTWHGAREGQQRRANKNQSSFKVTTIVVLVNQTRTDQQESVLIHICTLATAKWTNLSRSAKVYKHTAPRLLYIVHCTTFVHCCTL